MVEAGRTTADTNQKTSNCSKDSQCQIDVVFLNGGKGFAVGQQAKKEGEGKSVEERRALSSAEVGGRDATSSRM